MEKDKQSRKLYYSSTVTNFSLTPWDIGEINFHNCLVTSNSVTKYCRIRYYYLLLDFFKLLFLKNGFVWYFLLVASRLRASNPIKYITYMMDRCDIQRFGNIDCRKTDLETPCLNFKDSLDYWSSLLFG